MKSIQKTRSAYNSTIVYLYFVIHHFLLLYSRGRAIRGQISRKEFVLGLSQETEASCVAPNMPGIFRIKIHQPTCCVHVFQNREPVWKFKHGVRFFLQCCHLHQQDLHYSEKTPDFGHLSPPQLPMHSDSMNLDYSNFQSLCNLKYILRTSV